MVGEIKTSIKKFENMLYEKHGVTEKSPHYENTMGEYGPEVIKLWLYYLDGKHVGTYNRGSKIAYLIE